MNNSILKIIGISGLLLLFQQGKAQHVEIISDPVLDSIITATAEVNKENAYIQGYRIQIHFGSERKSALDAKTKFLQLFPETEAYLIYQQPYFKVRVGDYRTRYEAQATYKKLISEFEKMFIVPDRINLPKL